MVFYEEIDESEVRPAGLLEEYAALSRSEVERLILGGELEDVTCPACGSHKRETAFDRFGLTYRQCRDCLSLYASPRPPESTIYDYYRNSAAELFWHKAMFPATREARLDRIASARATWVCESARELLPNARRFLDIGCHQDGFLREVARTGFFEDIVTVNPLVEVADELPVSVVADRGCVEPLPRADVVSLLESVDRAADVGRLIQGVVNALPAGGLCFVTTTLGSGFDIQALWGDSPIIFPPDRLNLLTVEGWEALASGAGLEIIEFSTPGLFDVEIVRRHREAVRGGLPRFLDYLVGGRDRQVRGEFQQFLQKSRLSSHGRILLRRR